MVLGNFFDSILGWTTKLGGPWGIIIISFIITLITTLVYKYFTDQEALKKIRDDNAKLQEEMKNSKNDPKKMAELQKQMLQNGFMEPMKHQLKPLLITFVPFILIFSWLRTTYTPMGKLFLGMGWFGIYIISSIIFSMILRKMMKVY